MKKILIVTYSYPPSNGVGINRPYSWAKYFPENGLFPVVLTRHWKNYENSDHFLAETDEAVVIEKEKNITVIRNPFRRRLFRLQQLPLIGKALGLGLSLIGFVIPERDVVPFANSFLKLDEFKDVNYVIATCLPLSAVRAGVKISKKLNIPLILDFRDIWDNRLLNESFVPSSRYRLLIKIWEFHLRRWLRRASLITAVTEGMATHIRRLYPDAKIKIVPNGYDKTLFPEPAASSGEKFTFSCIGSLWPTQDFSCLLQGMHLFLRDKDLNTIQLNFIGAAIYPEVEKLLLEHLPRSCTTITKRVPQKDALKKMVDSDVLFYIGWKGFSGLASGKIYEYIGSRRNILLSPSDNDIIQEILSESQSGKWADSPEDFARILSEWYSEWVTNRHVSYYGLDTVIHKYSRRFQARDLANEIKKLPLAN